MPIAQANEKAVAGARCVNCLQPMEHRFTGNTQGEPAAISTRDFVGYYCTDENCPRHGTLTLKYRLPLESPKPAVPSPAKKS